MLKNNLLYLLFALIVLGTSSCEKIAEDELPISAPTEPSDGTGKVIYTYQNNEVAIDPTQLITVLEVKSYNLVSFPIHGKAMFLPDGILHYSPNENVIEADEDLVIEFFKNNGTSFKETITVKIVQEQAQLPCLIIAMSDKAKYEPNKEVIIDILANDEICEGTFKEIAILAKPNNGIATIINNKISYVPNQSFKGIDKLMYAFVLELNGKTVRRPAFVTVEAEKSITSGGGTNCMTSLRDDILEFDLTSISDKDSIFIPVLGNDILCIDDLAKGKISAGTLPYNGKISIVKDKLIFYKINKPIIPPMQSGVIDSFFYKFTNAIGVTKTAKVKLLFKKQGNCKLSALGDDYEFKLSNLAGQTFVELDVLKNDLLCSTQIKSLKIVENPPHISVTSNNKIKYSPPKFKNEMFKFKYQITDEKGDFSKSGDVRIKFVD